MLTVDEGDLVQVLTSCTAEQAWCYVVSELDRGYVPKSYLTANRCVMFLWFEKLVD